MQQEYQSITLPGRKPNEKFACIIRNVYTEDECKELIKLTEKAGYLPAKDGDQEGRSNYRCIIIDTDIAGELFNRIKKWLPQTWHTQNYNEKEEKFDSPIEVKLSCINECLRFQRYDKGQMFSKHIDGAYERPDGSECSHITIQLYLNDDFEGGETTFINQMYYKKENMDDAVNIVPVTGMCLVFEHELLHQGSAVTKGRKYTLRSDIMYKK